MNESQLYLKRILLFIFFWFFWLKSQAQNEGLVTIQSYSPIDLSGVPLGTKDILLMQEKKMWFKDSCVIYEIRTNLHTTESTNEGEIVKKSFPVLRYVYLDYRRMICQDYLDLKDTALPFCNYVLKPSDPIGIWQFFAPKNELDTLHGVFPLCDTLINNKNYKRFKILYRYYEYEKAYSIYYFDCNEKQNKFNVNRTLSDMNPTCKSSRSEFFDETNKLIYRSECNVVRDKLNLTEENIFKQWGQNALATKLPLITVSEASKIPIRDPEHENPIITILPRKEE